MVDLLEKEFRTVILKMLKDLQEDTGKTMYEQNRNKKEKSCQKNSGAGKYRQQKQKEIMGLYQIFYTSKEITVKRHRMGENICKYISVKLISRIYKELL